MPLFIALLFILFINGYGFTPLGAAKGNYFLSSDAELMEKYDTGSSVIFLFKSDEDKKYQTVLAEKSGLFFRSGLSTNTTYSDDQVQTVGGISFTSENDAATLLSVISYDDEVAYIEAGIEPDIEKKNINKGELVTFIFPYSEQINFLKPMAFSKDGRKLYYYGYPKNKNVFDQEDLKWHKVQD